MKCVRCALLVPAALAAGFAMVGCTGRGIEARPFTAYDETLQKVWDGPQSWAEDWCDQSQGFRDAYRGLVAYRMRPYRLTIFCPGDN